MKETGHRNAQLELDEKLFPHYLLGRQLAMEEVLKAFVRALPPKKVAEIAALVQAETDLGMQEIQDHDPEDDTPDHVCQCGFVCALAQMGF